MNPFRIVLATRQASWPKGELSCLEEQLGSQSLVEVVRTPPTRVPSLSHRCAVTGIEAWHGLKSNLGDTCCSEDCTLNLQVRNARRRNRSRRQACFERSCFKNPSTGSIGLMVVGRNRPSRGNACDLCRQTRHRTFCGDQESWQWPHSVPQSQRQALRNLAGLHLEFSTSSQTEPPASQSTTHPQIAKMAGGVGVRDVE